MKTMRGMTGKKTRFIAILMVCILVCMQMIHVSASTSYTEPTIVVSDVTAKAGDEAYVTIGLVNNPGISSMQLDVKFDTDVLTLKAVDDTEVYGGNSHKPELQSPYTLSWDDDKYNITDDDVAVTLVFDVAETAQTGSTTAVEVSYKLDSYHIMNENGQKVEFAIDNGSVTIGTPSANSIDDFEYDTNGTEMTITGYKGYSASVNIGSKYIVGGTEYTVVAVDESAFESNYYIHSLTIPETVTTISDYAFYDCIYLADVTVHSENVTIGEVALGYYPISRREDDIVDGFTLSGYKGSTAEAYATENEMTFVELTKECQHTGGTATCKDKAVCTSCGEAYGELNPSNHAGGTEVKGALQESCNTEGYTGDTWCKGCNTKIADGEKIPATGAHVDADNKWETNGTQHFHTCACGTEFDKEDHKGGTATCKDKAVCSVCGTSYGEKNANNHVGETYVKDQKETSCYEEGYTGDTYCSDCDVKIADGEAIPKSNHSPASVWSTDATYHWHECTVTACGNIIDKAEHSGGEATCKAQAICSVCRIQYGELNAKNHKNTEIRDAEPASCNKDGYTGDTWCKDCNTKIADGETIPATGEHVDANGKWESNGTQHFHTCACGTEFDKEDHKGGTATCKDKAACSVCGTAYGEKDAANHAGGTEVRGASSESCNEPGYTGDTYCLGCNTKIADGTTIDPNGNHVDADNKWEFDGTHHFHTCGCGTEFDKQGHTGGEATCKVQASCSVCNAAYGSLDAKNHKNTELRDVVVAECNTPGYTGDTWCLDCNNKIATGNATDPTGNHIDADNDWEFSENQHFHTCSCGTEFDKNDHTGGEATCKNKATCSVCGTAYGEVNANNHKGTTYLVGQKEASCYEEGYTGDTYCSDCDVKIATGTKIDKASHNPASVWSTDETHHWKVCTVVACGNIVDKAEHTGGTATCKDKAVCSVCNVAYGTVDATNHTGETYLVGEKKTSCDEAGYTGDIYCSGCDVKLYDGKSIDKVPHIVDEWNVTKNATTEECGEKSGTCVVCEEPITVTTAKLVSEIKNENIEGIEAEVESVGNTNLSEDVFFVADEIVDSIIPTEKTKVENAVKQLMGSDKEFELAAIFDLNLLLREKATNNDVIKETEFVLDGAVEVTIPVPTEAFETLTDIKLVHIKDDGTSEFITFTLKSGKATFVAREFGYYTFAGIEKTPAGEPDVDTNTPDTDSPQTGDMNSLSVWMVLLFVSASCITVFAIYNEKKRQNR